MLPGGKKGISEKNRKYISMLPGGNRESVSKMGTEKGAS